MCGIGDAKLGGLSSYTYILLLIYYLQRTSPPVLPVLQELHAGPRKPQCIVADYDVWFFDDLPNLVRS